jgi:hypothetical protein
MKTTLISLLAMSAITAASDFNATTMGPDGMYFTQGTVTPAPETMPIRDGHKERMEQDQRHIDALREIGRVREMRAQTWELQKQTELLKKIADQQK